MLLPQLLLLQLCIITAADDSRGELLFSLLQVHLPRPLLHLLQPSTMIYLVGFTAAATSTVTAVTASYFIFLLLLQPPFCCRNFCLLILSMATTTSMLLSQLPPVDLWTIGLL
jgi:hypothetical protein